MKPEVFEAVKVQIEKHRSQIKAALKLLSKQYEQAKKRTSILPGEDCICNQGPLPGAKCCYHTPGCGTYEEEKDLVKAYEILMGKVEP